MIQLFQQSKNKLRIVFFVTLFLVVPHFKVFSAGIIERPYGGLRLATIPCTCSSSPAKALVTIYDYVTLRPLRLSYIPKASVLYGYFNIWSSTYMLGSYNPYVRNSCLVTTTGTDCETVPDDGLMGALPGTGTSLY